jgi:hypothetical protein
MFKKFHKELLPEELFRDILSYIEIPFKYKIMQINSMKCGVYVKILNFSSNESDQIILSNINTNLDGMKYYDFYKNKEIDNNHSTVFKKSLNNLFNDMVISINNSHISNYRRCGNHTNKCVNIDNIHKNYDVIFTS